MMLPTPITRAELQDYSVKLRREALDKQIAEGVEPIYRFILDWAKLPNKPSWRTFQIVKLVGKTCSQYRPIGPDENPYCPDNFVTDYSEPLPNELVERFLAELKSLFPDSKVTCDSKSYMLGDDGKLIVVAQYSESFKKNIKGEPINMFCVDWSEPSVIPKFPELDIRTLRSKEFGTDVRIRVYAIAHLPESLYTWVMNTFPGTQYVNLGPSMGVPNGMLWRIWGWYAYPKDDGLNGADWSCIIEVVNPK